LGRECAKLRSGGRGGGGLLRLNWCVGSWMIDSIILIDETLLHSGYC